DLIVTGVQTCALPIFPNGFHLEGAEAVSNGVWEHINIVFKELLRIGYRAGEGLNGDCSCSRNSARTGNAWIRRGDLDGVDAQWEIGRASCGKGGSGGG